MISPKIHSTETLTSLMDSFHAHCGGVSPAPRKGPWRCSRRGYAGSPYIQRGFPISTIYLSGNPGCGKSQVARLTGQEIFNKRSQESTRLTFVATLDAETLETLADSYIGLGRNLGITEYTLTSLVTSKDSSSKEIIQHLTRLNVKQMKQFSK